MKWLYLAGISLLIQACGGGGSSPVAEEVPAQPLSCSIVDQRQNLHAYMGADYLWYPQLKAPNEGASDMDGYFRSMLYTPLDRYSFTQTTDSFNQVFFGGRRLGYGYTMVWGDEARTTMRVRTIEPDSPVARAGLRRGDTVLAVDDFTPTQVMAGQVPAVDAMGVERRFLLRTAEGGTRELKAASGWFDLRPLAVTTTFEVTRNGVPVKVAYVAYHQFVGYTLWELALAFSRFASAGVGEVIVDLRYNGGGSVGTSRDLASMISGSRTDGQVFTTLKYSDKQSARNVDYPFMTAETRFTAPIEGLNRVIVLTSASTASASELVINGLRPYMPVVLIGETTFGKPYGFTPRSACGTTYSAVQFETVNGLGVGGYSAGFTPECTVPDDLDHELGDPQERRTRAALDYIATGRCSAQSPLSASVVRARPAPEVAGETVPSQMFAN